MNCATTCRCGPPAPCRGLRRYWCPRQAPRLTYDNAHKIFKKLTAQADIKPRSPACRPRMHDLRHSFAVNTLLDAYRSGGDVAERIPLLSTYLGHTEPANTYWYLHAAPELLALAADKLNIHDAKEGR